MKAVLSTHSGGPESLSVGELPDPVVGAGQVRIRVSACAINYPDVLMIQDRYQLKPPRPFAPGGDVAGVIESVGAGVSTLRVGERVLACCGWGGLAQLVVVSESRVHRIPDAMPFDVAAATPLTYATSHYALHERAQLRSGETLLILGAAGGVGLAAVELGKSIGARVVAAASSAAKVALALEHGADVGLVYPTDLSQRESAKALSERFKSACGAMGANVIYDAVGGEYSEAALRAIAWAGRFLVVGFPAGIARIPLNLVLLKSCQIVGVFYGAAMERDPEADRRRFQDIIGLYERGAIRPQVSERLPMQRAGEAIGRVATRQALGKIVVMIG